MKTLAQLEARQAEIDARQNAIIAEADAAGGVLTAEQRTEFDSLGDEHKANITAIATAKAEQQKDLQRKADLASRATSPDPRRTQPTGATPTRIEAVQPEKFKSLGEQLHAIASAELNRQPDNRLVWENTVPQAAVSGAGSSIPSDGGYLIQKEIQTELMSKVYADEDVLARCKRVQVGPNSDGLVVNMIDESSRATGSRWGGVQVYWGAEADSATAKKPKFRQQKWELKDLIGLAYITDRLLADATALESVFSQAFTSELTFTTCDGVFNGTGGGQMTGLLNAGCTVSVAKETGQPAATVVYENLIKMYSRLYAPSRGNAVWFINQDVEQQLHQMAAPVGTGGQLVYLPPGGLSQSPYATLFGRPVVPTEYNPTLGTTGDVVLADLSQYLIVEKGGVQADSSITSGSRTTNGRSAGSTASTVSRCGEGAITPAKGSVTKGPFVKLDTRS